MKRQRSPGRRRPRHRRGVGVLLPKRQCQHQKACGQRARGTGRRPTRLHFGAGSGENPHSGARFRSTSVLADLAP
jgi:hypothetical protein